MDLASLSRRNNFNTGTVVGVVVALVALLGSSFLDWEWSASLSQPIPLAIGILAAAAGALVVYQKIKN